MQMISNVDKRTIFALNIHKSNVLVVDADEKKTVKIVNMVKHLGVAGYREELFWMMTTRSTGQLDRQCNLLPHTYRYIDNVPVSVSSDYIMEKIQRRNLASLNRNRNGITGKKPSVKELNTHTQSWFTLNTLTMQPEEHSHSTSEDLQPVVRVAIAHTTAPWVIVEEVSKTHTDQAACGRTGMLGKKFVNGTGTVKICAYGYVIDLLNLLKTKLLFEAVISTSRDGKYGSYDLETGENDGIVREVLENKADIGIDLTENKGRSKALWFSNPHLIAPMAVAYIEKNSFDESSIFGPFSNNLYIGIIGMIVGLVVIVFVTEHVSPYSGFQMKKRCLVDMEDFGTLDSATYVWGTLFTGEIIEKKPKSSGSRTMVLAFSCASVVILSAYSGNLITYLVVLDERPPISGLLDPKIIGKESTMKIGIPVGTVVGGLIKTHSDARVRNLYGRLTHCPSFDECVKKIKRKEIDLFMSDGPTLRYYASIDHSCSLRVMDLTERDRAIGIVARKNWSWRRRINTAINHIVSSGNADYIYAKWLGKLPCKRTNTFFSLDIMRLKHLFVLLAGFMAGCILVCLTLRIFCKFYTKKKDDTDKEYD
ncbi:glutamate receptor ionotropic, NMDA 2B-like [Rhopilema esculentum]|uniref:glutamate receptor ionotropic, NMDA 2B-like n=1 Tax=Rhopilema esculentum TaxID=499914 RepID=UPI0031D8ED7C